MTGSLKMILQLHPKHRCHLLIDIDTQKDFLLAAGSACVRNHRKVLANINRVMAWVRRENVPVISIADVHPNNNSHGTTGYCRDDTDGQKKLLCTLLKDRVSFPADNKNALPMDILRAYRQVILHKRCIDPFDEPRIERLLSEVVAEEFILIGIGTEDAVKATAVGLLQRGRKVRIIVDALGSRDTREAKLALRKMQAKGAKLIMTRDVTLKNSLRVRERYR